MSLRLTDTDKWDDGWYGELDPDFKNAWNFLNDNCDTAGVWDPNFRIANAKIGGKREGFKLDWDAFRKEAGSRIEVLENGKWWNTKHISFQCRGPLSFYGKKGANKPHISIRNLLRHHGLLERYAAIEIKMFGSSRLTEPLDEPPSKPRDEAQGAFRLQGEPPPKDLTKPAKDIIDHLNTKAGRKFSHSEENLRLVTHVLEETKCDSEGIKQMVTRTVEQWKGTDFEEYLQPSTLFAKTKWREKYDKRDEPVHRNGKAKANHEGGF